MEWWSTCISPPLARKTRKPRTSGITMVIDKALDLSSAAGLMESAADYIDIIKFTAGTALLCKKEFIRQKIRIFRSHNVDVMLGGTLTEIAIAQDTYSAYLEMLKDLECNTVEVADGSIVLPKQKRRDVVKHAIDSGFRVITEVGKEDDSEALSLEDVVSLIAWDAESGAHLINLEAREFGNVGVYNEDGSIRDDLLEAIKSSVPDMSKILWEAPLFGQQVDLIRRLGTEVNLANIQPNEVLRLETVRRGLIGDTLRDALRREKA